MGRELSPFPLTKEKVKMVFSKNSKLMLVVENQGLPMGGLVTSAQR
jgi:hypothetical protein